MFSRLRPLLFALALTPTLPACGTGPTIPGTQIPDSAENREVLHAVERYRIAMVQRDASAILAGTHPTYFDTGGTDDPIDDVSYEELGPMLRERMSQLQSVRFTIDYLELSVDKDRAIVKVWIDASFRLGPPVGEEQTEDPRVKTRYARVQDYNMFELLREGKSWLITAGL